MMLEADGVHPDEATIHAWLDGELDAQEAARLDAHVAECASCGSRVAEARGLIAGASRVVGLLDEQPAPLVKPLGTPSAGTGGSVWRLLRVTPARAAIAAALVVAVGIGLTRGQLGVDSRVTASDSSASGVAQSDDSVLSSAIARRLATEQPPRTVAAAPGVSIPTNPAEATSASASNVGDAATKVLAGRASIVAQRESAGTRADRTRAGVGQLATGVADARERVAVAANAADSVGRPALMGQARGVVPSVAAGECYLVESAAPAAWGSVQLPMIVAMDSAGRLARVLTTSGADTEARALLQYNGSDSAIFRLRRLGFVGSMTLAATGATHTGTMRSGSTPSNPAARAVATPPAPAPAMARGELGGAPLIPVTARRVNCPAR